MENKLTTIIKENAIKAIIGVSITSAVGGLWAGVRISSSAVAIVFADQKRIDLIEQQLESDFLPRSEYERDQFYLQQSLQTINANVQRNNQLIIDVLRDR